LQKEQFWEFENMKKIQFLLSGALGL
jgi:hypothetical protein